MPQAPEVCGVSLHVCRVRVTRLDSVGSVAPEPNNSYVSDKPISVQLTPTIETGTDTTLKGGCDCIVATYQGPDLLKGFELEFAKAAVEPAMEEMMLGATVILDESTVPVPIGLWHPGPLDCAEVQSACAFEFWTDVWEGSGQNADWPYIHHVYPYTTWQMGQQSYENDFAQPTLSGKARANSAWGAGPYGDQPEAIPTNSPGGFFYQTEAMPDAECGYDSVTPGTGL